ncbi:MAG: cytochrome c-type biogenesis CcmF C-terminal domain-containing protein, partial [Ilumatobacteraceae bacterium]
ILVAVALAASNSYTRSGEFTLGKGETIQFAGHSFTLLDVTDFKTARAVGIKAEISIDGGQAYAPAISKYTATGQDIATPSVRTGFANDIYLTLENGSKPSAGEAKIKVFIKPMVVWLWIGGLLCAFGTLLAAFPGRNRRRATDPVSAPIDLSDDTPPVRRGSEGIASKEAVDV